MSLCNKAIKALIPVFLGTTLAMSGLHGLPSDPTFIQGDAEIQRTETSLTVTAKGVAIIDWPTFSIDENEEIFFQLFDADSVVINSVSGTLPSKLEGSLRSNGRVALINQEGIGITESGTVSCVCFTASTIPISKDSFLKGRGTLFSGETSQELSNEGTIECKKDVIFVSTSIENKGVVRSKEGIVCMAAGKGAYIKEERPPSTAYILGDGLLPRIFNSGSISAESVLLKAHGTSSHIDTIINTGTICTTAAREKAMMLLADEGSFVHKGSLFTHGGGLIVVGKNILLADDSRIDSSSKENGGNIFIGGGLQGKDPEIPNADTLVVERKASINASSLTKGNGGSVVLWANETNTFLGSIASDGKGKDGDGGTAEVSALNTLIFDGTVSLASEEGTQGSLLLDPVSITIQSSNPDIDGNGSNLDMTSATQLNSATTTPTGFPNASSVITSGAVGSLLSGGVSMTLAAQNFISVNSSITATGAGNSIFFNAPTLNLNQPILSSLSTSVALTSSASTVNVGASGIIQQGVDLVTVGGRVNLASALFIQEVSIQKNLTLNGNGIGNTSIACPNTPLSNTFVAFSATYHPIVMVQSATNVVLQNLTVDGRSLSDNFLNFRFLGIAYDNAGGNIVNVRATNIQDGSPGGGTQHGQAIFGVVDNGSPYSLTVQNCIVDNFQKGGISMRGPTLTTVISGNTVTGETPPSNATANGIIVQRGTSATITNNLVTNILAPVAGIDSVGIFVVNPGNNTSITNNVVNSNNIGIYADPPPSVSSSNLFHVIREDLEASFLEQNSSEVALKSPSSTGLIISNNSVNTNTNIGIVAQNSSATIASNFVIEDNIFGSNANINLYLYSAENQGFTLARNHFTGSQDSLVVQGENTVGPVVTMDHDVFVGASEYYIQELVNPPPLDPQRAPNNIWPSTATVSFDGLISGQITETQFQQLLTKIYDKHNDPLLGLVLDYIPLPPSNFVGKVKRRHHPSYEKHFVLRAHWTKSPSSTVAFYNIYANGKVVKKVQSTEELKFHVHRHTKHVHKKYQVSAVGTNGLESSKVALDLES